MVLQGILVSAGEVVSTVGGFARYAFENMIRSRRRTFSAIIGIVLAVALISGEVIAVDSTTKSIVQNSLQNVPVDFSGKMRADETDYMGAVESLEHVRNITRVEPYSEISTVLITNPSNGNTSVVKVIAVRDEFGEVLSKFGLAADSFALESPGSIVLTRKVASALGIAEGNETNVTLFKYVNNWENNTALEFTVRGGFVYGKNEGVKYKQSWNRAGNIVPDTVFVRIDDWGSIRGGLLNGTNATEKKDAGIDDSYHFYIWMNRYSVINPYDKAATTTNLKHLQAELKSKGLKYGVTVDNSPVADLVDGITTQMDYVKMILLGVSIPVIVLGLYLGVIGFDLSMNERRREIGIIKARGGSEEQVFWLLTIEALFLGVISGVIGLLCGAATSKIILSYIPGIGLAGRESISASITDTVVTPTAIVLSVGFGILLAFVAGALSAKRVSGISIAESLHFYSHESTKDKYNPTWDLVMIVIAVCVYVNDIFNDPNSAGDNCCLALGSLACLLSGGALSTVVPVFLIFGITRFATRSSNALYDIMSEATRPMTKDLHYIVNKNIIRNPRRVSRVCVIIATAISLGIMVTALADTQMKFEDRTLTGEIGSDISVTAFKPRSFESDIAASSSDINSVTTVTWFGSTTLDPYYYQEQGWWGNEDVSLTVTMLDSESYKQTVRPEQYYFTQGSPSSLENLRQTFGNDNRSKCDIYGVIISDDIVELTGVGLGQYLPIIIKPSYVGGNGPEFSMVFQVVGVVKLLPGAQSSGIDSYRHIYVDYQAITMNAPMMLEAMDSHRVIIDVKDGADSEKVADSILKAHGKDIFEMRVLKTEKGTSVANPTFTAVLQFMNLEYAFTVVIITIGLGLIMFVASLEREREMAGIVTRGGTRGQIMKLFLGESLSLTLVGLLIGVPTGLLTAYAYNELISRLINTFFNSPIEHKFELTYTVPIVIIITTVVLIAASALVAYKASRVTLGQALRVRGG